MAKRKITLPSARSLRLLRGEGYEVGTVEKWNPFAGPINEETGKPTGIRQDLFGFVDLIAIRADTPGTLYVQSTSASNIASRITKSIAVPVLSAMLESGNRVEVHGWAKRPVTKTRKREKWEVIRREITGNQADGFVASDIEEEPF